MALKKKKVLYLYQYSNGVIRVYDSNTNTFGVYNSNGKTITFFKPSHGQRYFDTQPGELK